MAVNVSVDKPTQAYNLLPTDANRAVRELEFLAFSGSVESMIYLGTVFDGGFGVKKDHNKAISWFEKAYKTGSDKALLCLGRAHFDCGEYKEAESVFLEGVRRKYPPSLYWIAQIYLKTPDDRKKIEQALQMLESGSKLGHAFARRDLGQILRSGRFGVWAVLRGIWLYFSAIFLLFKLFMKDPQGDRFM